MSLSGFLLQIVAKPGEEGKVEKLVSSCVQSLGKSSSIHLCYGLKYTGPAFPNVPVKEGTTSTSAIVGVCKNKVDLEKNLQSINGLLNGNGNVMNVAVENPKVQKLDIFASKTIAGNPTVGARVFMEARPERAAEVKAFLGSIVPDSEANAHQWFAFQVEGTNIFGITGYFADDSSRNNRLSGEATKAMFARGKEWFIAPPDAVKVDVLGN